MFMWVCARCHSNCFHNITICETESYLAFYFLGDKNDKVLKATVQLLVDVKGKNYLLSYLVFTYTGCNYFGSIILNLTVGQFLSVPIMFLTYFGK